MRILFLAPQPFFVERGTPIAVRYAVEALCRAGHEVDLLVLHEGADLHMPGLTIHRAGRPPFVAAVPIGMSASKLACDAFLVAAATRLLMQRRYDVVHAVEEAVFPALLLKLPGRFKLVYDMDSLLGEQIVEKWPRLSFLRPLLRAVEGWPMRGADLVLPVCSAIAERVAREAPGQTIHVLPDAAPAKTTGDPAEPVMNLRALVGGEGPIALYVGNLEHYQGVDLLLEAMADLPADNDLSLVIVGGTRDHLAEARATIGRLRIEDRVHLAGPAPLAHLPHLLAQADILCSPRIAGVNTPMKLYAYMQAERAIIATAILSHTQVLSSAHACLVAPERGAIAAGLTQLADDASLRARLGEAAGKAAEDYSPAAFEARLRTAYAALGEAEPRRERPPLAAMRRGQ
ncbi:glycosyltransferase family 4 protein [Sphingomonas sp. CCH5-D11]|uniref:glycosyltransferase family 4 protein n=1 Tax=Sphingomonas sp. CCH5-D11 TaxID=1768786 RepID=UPI000830CD43|nr:glycosyltransferase family 4 protein [Sphingomonas sp. CCH5-D11]